MASQVIPISRLNLEPETVKCPACQHVGKSIRVMETTSNAHCLIGVIACLMCNCGAMTAPTYHFLSHYCSACGIRFVVVPWYEQPILHLDRSVLVDDGDAKGKIAPSPLGPPPQVDETVLRNFAHRHSTWMPSQTLEIQLQGMHRFPAAVFDVSTSKQVYNITWPGAKGFLVEYKSSEPMASTPGKNDKLKIKSMGSWNPKESTPHIRVSAVDDQRDQEVATAQVFATSRDYILHTPRTTNGVTTYESRRSGIRGQVSIKSGYMVWNSCAGPLAWIERYVRDQQMEKVLRRIVLMDAYDRLLGMMDPGEKEDSVQLRLYGRFSEELVAEILASFSAVSYVVWNYARLEGRDGGEDIDGAGVASIGFSFGGL